VLPCNYFNLFIKMNKFDKIIEIFRIAIQIVVTAKAVNNYLNSEEQSLTLYRKTKKRRK
jgi:hypothetical protein